MCRQVRTGKRVISRSILSCSLGSRGSRLRIVLLVPVSSSSSASQSSPGSSSVVATSSSADVSSSSTPSTFVVPPSIRDPALTWVLLSAPRDLPHACHLKPGSPGLTLARWLVHQMSRTSTAPCSFANPTVRQTRRSCDTGERDHALIVRFRGSRHCSVSFIDDRTSCLTSAPKNLVLPFLFPRTNSNFAPSCTWMALPFGAASLASFLNLVLSTAHSACLSLFPKCRDFADSHHRN